MVDRILNYGIRAEEGCTDWVVAWGALIGWRGGPEGYGCRFLTIMSATFTRDQENGEGQRLTHGR
jgi:hypothetical protein